jgi:hypothetical protein
MIPGMPPPFSINIISQGKLMYFVDAMLPDMHDSLKIGYTAAQLKWCQNNEPADVESPC